MTDNQNGGAAMTPKAHRIANPSRLPIFDFDSRKEPRMQHIELRLADIGERQALLRSIRDAERDGLRSARTLRHQLGQSLVRLGRRIGGEAMTSPAWQG
jgi:hypothetical protein